MQSNKPVIVADLYQLFLDDYINKFMENEQDAIKGTYHAFDEVYLPILKKQGVNILNLVVGGERAIQVINSETDEYRFWDAHNKLDILNSELEAGCSSFILCKTSKDIDMAISNGKIAIIATLSGGKPLEGKPNLNLLSSLRSLYRMGLRGLQLTGNGRNRLGDGIAQERTKGRLTSFGKQVVDECNRLGILIDSAQLSNYGFYDLISITSNPIIDSHTCAYDLSNHPQNISKDRIMAIAQTGGVIGISFLSAQVAYDKEYSTIQDLIKQIDYFVNVAGIDHVSLGPGYSGIKTPKDRENIIGYGNLGPDYCGYDYRTPILSEKYPGWIDGIWHGIRKNDYIEGASERETFGQVIKALKNCGYSKNDCEKIFGKNVERVYKAVLG